MAKETANNGWICLHRTMREWQHYDNVFVKAVFIDLLLSATAKPCWSCGIRLTRGQTLRSSRKIEEDNKISRPTVLRALRTLEESGEIVREKISQKLVKTTIVNYSKYQDINFVSGKNEIPQRLPQRLPQSLPQTTSKQDNNIIVDDNKYARTHEEIIKDMFKSQITIEAFCKNEGITVEQCRKLADEVLVEWSLVGETHRTDKEAKRHLLDHIRKKAQAMNVQGTTPDERKAQFVDECKQLIAQGFNKQEVAEFASYYTQPTADGRMLFETFKGWDTLTRFQLYLNKKSWTPIKA